MKRQDPLQKATRRIETEGRKHCLCIYSATAMALWQYMRQQQLKWIRPQIMACMLIALHRKYGFGFERCSRIYQQISDIEAEYRANPERLRKACYEMTGIDTAKTVTTDRRDTTSGSTGK